MAGINRAIKSEARRTEADADTIREIQSATNYGAILAGTVATPEFPGNEAPRVNARKNRGVGKTDLDSRKMPSPGEKQRHPSLRRRSSRVCGPWSPPEKP